MVRGFEENPLLCPVQALLAYVRKTRHRRGKVDELFVLVTTHIPRPASKQSVCRWVKDILSHSGLDKYNVHSTRSASSCSSLLMGLPLDQIVSRVGWMWTSTFIKHYFKPKDPMNLEKDPHGFASVIANVSP